MANGPMYSINKIIAPLNFEIAEAEEAFAEAKKMLQNADSILTKEYRKTQEISENTAKNWRAMNKVALNLLASKLKEVASNIEQLDEPL